jgi:2-polyprenyl-6-methoxyphenol hydroxylase-like FAD-dependent oxidoreductase
LEEDAMDYDAIVVGARVAGSSLAIQLGRQGKRVLMVDRDSFPSDTLSTHLLQPPAVEMLDRLGVLADVESSGLRRLGRLRTSLGDVVIEGPLRSPGAYALCARRDRLDMALIRQAVCRHGVELQERTRVHGLIWEDGCVTGVELQTADGARRLVRAPVVVGADGKYSKVAAWTGAERYDEVPAMRPVYYGYFRGVTPQPEPALEVFYKDGHIGFLLPMEPGIDCLVLEIQPEEFPAFRSDPAERLETAFSELPGMATRLAGAERDGPVRGIRGVENYLRQPYGPGWALTGDAAFCKDPSTGTGIEDAFRQSFLLAGALNAALDGAEWEATMAEFHRKRDELVMPGYRSTLTYTQTEDASPETLSWLQAVAANAGLVRLLGQVLPAALQTPGALPAGLLRSIERSAGRFADAERQDERQAA